MRKETSGGFSSPHLPLSLDHFQTKTFSKTSYLKIYLLKLFKLQSFYFILLLKQPKQNSFSFCLNKWIGKWRKFQDVSNCQLIEIIRNTKFMQNVKVGRQKNLFHVGKKNSKHFFCYFLSVTEKHIGLMARPPWQKKPSPRRWLTLIINNSRHLHTRKINNW